MDLDDLEPKKPKAYELGQDLAKLSIKLKALIETLKGEIGRVEATVAGRAIDAQRRRRGLQALIRSLFI